MNESTKKKGEWTASVWISALLGVAFIALGVVLIAKDEMIKTIGTIQIRSAGHPGTMPTNAPPELPPAQ